MQALPRPRDRLLLGLGGTPMSQSNVITGTDSTPVYRVRKIGPADLKDAVAKGLADFSAKPSHLVFLGLIYPLVGIGLVVGASPQLIFPLLSGFALIGPFAGIGLYEIDWESTRLNSRH